MAVSKGGSNCGGGDVHGGGEPACRGCGGTNMRPGDRALSQCLGYLQNKGGLLPPCCNGVKNLNNLARSTPDRQQACVCLKNLAAGVRGLNYGLAAGLPGKCGISIPYQISPSTDCTKVK